MNRQFNNIRRCSAAWMLLAAFAWILQPVGTSLFCHDDFSHGHASPSQSSGDNRGDGHNHDHAASHSHNGAHSHEASSNAAQGSKSQSPQPAPKACCCQPQETPVTAVATISHSGSDGKAQAVSPPLAILPLIYKPEVEPTVSTRAGPDIPSLYSQLCRFSFSTRAPPYLA